MLEFTSTSKPIVLLSFLSLLTLAVLTGGAPIAHAQGDGDAKPSESRTNKPEEEDYSSTPFTEYGEFNESNEEESDAKFFQFGRFFGVSIGMGFQFIDGNRGSLWQGGFPVVDFKVHYWFDFNVGLDLGFYTASQFYNTQVQGKGHVNVNWLRVGIDIKYYFPTKNLSSAITFANPYVLLGVGSYSKTENSNATQVGDQDASLGICGGAGFEFVVSPKKTYFELEIKANLVTFKDTFTTLYAPSLPNLTGNFYTITGSLLFTW